MNRPVVFSLLCLIAMAAHASSLPDSLPSEFGLIPAGRFEMGDHHSLGAERHPSDEIPVHGVRLDAFHIGKMETTNRQYCEFLNEARQLKWIRVERGQVTLPNEQTVLCETRPAVSYSGIIHDRESGIFSVVPGREDHPAVGVRWEGAALFCNWLSYLRGHPELYNTKTWTCDFSKSGFRLPTEAEWEYAARGGLHDPYCIFPWGDEPDGRRANWPRSGDPYEYCDYPWTTPVGFYNGKTHSKSDFHWPSPQDEYQTASGVNGYGLYDMCGNVWEWVNDWYGRDYYRQSPSENPTGPVSGSIMPDGKAYREMRGGNWYNGQWGHSRVANRDPGYYRGPQDPDHPYYHVGFRPVFDPGSNAVAESEQRELPPIRNTVGLLFRSHEACPGYTLMAPKHAAGTYLIDLDGRVVHQWTSSLLPPGQSVCLLSDGRLLRTCMVKQREASGIGGGEGGRIEMYDWGDNLIWEYDLPGLHHDIAVMDNGHILALYTERKTFAEAQEVGFTSDILRDQWILPDCVFEIKPTMPRGGEIVWRWRVSDHLIQSDDPRKPNYADPARNPGRIWTRCNGRRAQAFWNHMNSIDYNADLDQILLSVRGCSEIWVVDHSTTTEEAAGSSGGRYGKGGDLLYRWGNPAAYNARGVKQLFDQHDARWIPDGYPGAGDILIFNNGLNRPGGEYSSVEQIAPPIGSDGNYELDGPAYGPAKPTWSWKATDPMSFFSSQISGAFRLPNGNTLICAGVYGELIEVTQSGEVVWKYVNPVTNTGILAQGERAALDHRGHNYNAVFKIERIAPNDQRLAGKTLKPMGVLEKPPGQGTADTLDSAGGSESQRRGPGRPPGQLGYDNRGQADFSRPGRRQDEPRENRFEGPLRRSDEVISRPVANREYPESDRGRQSNRSPQGRARGSTAAGQEQRRGARSRNTADTLKVDVPEFGCNIILGRPTASSVDLSVLSQTGTCGRITFWPKGTNAKATMHLQEIKAGEPLEVTLSDLNSRSTYEYAFACRSSPEETFQERIKGSFQTAGSVADAFVFTVQADSHLDSPETAGLYRHVLNAARQDQPDLHFALGDTFMTGNYGDRYKEAEGRYLVQRDILSTLCHSTALFFVPGNHDGKWGRYLDGTADNLAVWATGMRKKYLPNPHPGEFYSGNTQEEPFVGSPENYFAFEWGPALFVTLDPYRYAGGKSRSGDAWKLTLGKEQYDWLAETLRSSKAPFKFVFVHQLVGGAEGNGRGGAEFARFHEWGGHDYNDQYTFRQKRRGWEKPIHELLKETAVSVVFHGHDHFYAYQELDGIVYQLVPQPGRAVPPGTPRQADEYGYRRGTILPGSGYLRGTVSAEETAIEYVRVPSEKWTASGLKPQAEVVHSYTVSPRKP
jgi:formylglycine-generating enzyme required for sulfatase activity